MKSWKGFLPSKSRYQLKEPILVGNQRMYISREQLQGNFPFTNKQKKHGSLGLVALYKQTPEISRSVVSGVIQIPDEA